MALERLQKILAHAGVASRRKAEALIEAGKVSVNGKVVRELGSKADLDEDVIQVEGRTIREEQEKVYYVLYKPAGCVTTLSDPEGRATIKTYLGEIPERVDKCGAKNRCRVLEGNCEALTCLWIRSRQRPS